jgi:two-component system, OmpR family, sensor kinase
MAASSEATTMSHNQDDPTPPARRGVITFAIPAAATAAAVATPSGLVGSLDGLLGWSEMMFTLLGVVAGASGALIAQAAALLTGNRRWSWVSALLWLYALLVLPAEPAMNEFGVGNAATARMALLLLVAASAAIGLRAQWVPAQRTGRIAAIAAVGLLSLVRLAAECLPGAARVLVATPALGQALLATAGLVACAMVRDGMRSGSIELAALGAGSGMIVLGHLRQAVVGQSPLPILRLVGVAVIVGGLLAVLSGARRAIERRMTCLEDDLAVATVAQERMQRNARERDHELRNGLTGLAGLPELIEQPPPDPERTALRSAVESELGRLAVILDGREPVDGRYHLQSLVAEVTAMHASDRTTAAVPSNLWVAGRRTAAGQVLANVLINCARHAPGAAVQICASSVRDRIRVEVRDDGPGVAPEVRRRIFERCPDDAGSGMGLSISRRLLAAEGASIAVDAGAGSGCCVVVDLCGGGW